MAATSIQPSEPLASVALFTKFPDGPQMQMLRHRLAALDIKIASEHHLSERMKTSTVQAPKLANVDAVFFMFDMCSHAEQEKVRLIAKHAGKRMFLLHRKFASWEKDLSGFFAHVAESRGEPPVSEQRISVVQAKALEARAPEGRERHLFRPEQLAEACRTVMRMRDEGVSWLRVDSAVSVFYDDSVPRVHSKSYLFIRLRLMCARGRLPADFMEWFQKNNPSDLPVRNPPQFQAVPAEPSPLHTEPVVALRIAPPPPSSDDMLQLYEADNQRLEAEVRRLTEENRTARLDGAKAVATALVAKLLELAGVT